MASGDVLETAPLDISVDQAAAVLEAEYDLTGVAIVPLPGDRDRNFAITGRGGAWMLKIGHPAERAAVLECQQRALNHVRVWDPDLPVPRAVPTSAGALVATVTLADAAAPVRLATFIPGVTVEQVGWNRQLRRHAAALCARLGLALRSFSCTESGAPDLWHIDRVSNLRPYLNHLNPQQARFAERWLDHYDKELIGGIAELRRQVIHGDFNPANLVVGLGQPDVVAGIVDFGDMTDGPLVADLAIAAAYQCLGSGDPGAVLADAAVSYHRLVPLSRYEAAILPDLAVSRLVQSLIISGWRSVLHPDNREYILMHAAPIWEALQLLEEVGSVTVAAEILDRCGLDPVARHGTDEVLAARRLRLGSGLRLTYDRPLHVTAGSGVWLTDTDGVRHLDAYNNVAHVGHSNPDVVAALTRQAGWLNTNTRYLVDDVVAYADRLANMLPDPLQVVLFANSGSEANDLAWRIARTVTGCRGMIVTDHAYHGSTYLTMATSPEELGRANLESWVSTVPAPTGSPAPTGAGADLARLDRAAIELEARGEGLAGYACDTVFSSDGIFDAPAGYLEGVYARVRDAGGLCIADEVQAGFGRVGSRIWGFAGSEAVPDIVTLGKPMGNGHPLAAVVTTAEIAEEFFQSGYYFSTFAGNPVSAAVGSAVLDVMEREGLPARADRVGAYLRAGLADVAESCPSVTAIRGPGMFIGVELLDSAGNPASVFAETVQNRMRAGGVLIGRTGVGGNVLKIRPPLVFAERHADQLLETLDRVLTELDSTI